MTDYAKLSKQQKKGLEPMLVRIIQDSPQPLHASEVHYMLEDRAGITVDMHMLLARLKKLALKHRIVIEREKEPPFRKIFSAVPPPDSNSSAWPPVMKSTSQSS